MTRKGILIVLSGFSGTGKGTVMKELLKKYDNYALSVSATTRKPRTGEVEGREYFFKSKDEFEQMISGDKLIEHAVYVDNYYGTPRDYVERMLDSGKDVILEIEIQGALEIKRKFPDTLLMFMMPPSMEELKKRLTGRGTEDEATIVSRLKRAVDEAESIENYEYTLINDNVDDCVEMFHNIINSEHCKVKNNMALINNIKSELNKLSEGE